MMKTLFAAAAGTAMLIALPVGAMQGASSGSQYIDYVVQEMMKDVARQSEMTFREAFVGSIDGGTSVTHRIRTDGTNGLMRVYGNCGQDCSDLDISVIAGGSGELVAQDAASDDIPIVSFEPVAGNAYEITVTMYACSQSPCYYSVSTYS